MNYFKSFVSVALTIFCILLLSYTMVTKKEVVWYFPIITTIILTVADSLKPMGHYLTVALMLIAASFYGACALTLLFVLKTSFITSMVFLLMATLIIHTFIIESITKKFSTKENEK